MVVQGRQTLVGEKRGDWLEGKKNGILYGGSSPGESGSWSWGVAGGTHQATGVLSCPHLAHSGLTASSQRRGGVAASVGLAATITDTCPPQALHGALCPLHRAQSRTRERTGGACPRRRQATETKVASASMMVRWSPGPREVLKDLGFPSRTTLLSKTASTNSA